MAAAAWQTGAVALLALVVSATAAEAQSGGAARLRAPESADCPRDHLTAYAGRVLRYRRTAGRTDIRIRTDEQTTENVSIAHPGSDDPSRWFRVAQQPFTKADWPRLELRHGELRSGLRVVAWVCDDGRNPVLDWRIPAPD